MANSPRPGVWALERSTDKGQTWQPWQYFAGSEAECKLFFNVSVKQTPQTDEEIICTNEFSKIVPLEGAEVCYFRLIWYTLFISRYVFIVMIWLFLLQRSPCLWFETGLDPLTSGSHPRCRTSPKPPTSVWVWSRPRHYSGTSCRCRARTPPSLGG